VRKNRLLFMYYPSLTLSEFIEVEFERVFENGDGLLE